LSQGAALIQGDRKRLYKAGAVSVILAGVLVLITVPLIPLLLPSLAPPTVQSGLQALQSQGSLYATTWGLYLVSDILYVIVFPALYFAMKQVNRTMMLIAVILNTLFVGLDVGLDIPLRLSLVGLSNSYSSSTGAAQQAYLATAKWTMDAANITALVATLLQFVALILASFVMTRSQSFRRSTGYIGIVSGVLALLFIPAFALGSPSAAGIFNLGGFIFLGIWSLLAGYRLRKLG
jgi:hypothetical protein